MPAKASDDNDEPADFRMAMPRGIPVDAMGGSTVDPTKNVLDLTRAESKYQDARRNDLEKLLNTKIQGQSDIIKILSESIISFQNAQREAETKRIDQLAQNRQEFQNTIRDMLAESVRTTSTLVSDQLKQIQATFDTRVTKLEAGAFTEAGKKSVADPQLQSVLSGLSAGLRDMQETMARSLVKMTDTNAEAIKDLSGSLRKVERSEEGTTSRHMGRGEIIAYAMMGVLVLSQIVVMVGVFLPHVGR